MHSLNPTMMKWMPLGVSTVLVISVALVQQKPGFAQAVLTPTPETAAVGSELNLNQNYTLGPGDRINISMFGAEQYSGEALVLSDGSVNLPTAGRVSVQGMTMEEAASAIAAQYAPYVRRPRVTVTPVALRPVRIGVSGEVNRPGSYTVSPGENGQTQFPTVTEAIELAGGITAMADLRSIEVRRPNRFRAEQTVRINFWELLQTGDMSKDVLLQAGDSIHIPTAVAMTPEEATRLGNASFAPDSIRVYVAGEVGAPGALELPPNTPLNQAILAAGGFNQRAERDSVELVRLNPNGTAAKQEIEVDLAEGINDETNPALRDQDVILVRRSGLASFSDTADLALGPLGRVINGILGIFNIFR